MRRSWLHTLALTLALVSAACSGGGGGGAPAGMGSIAFDVTDAPFDFTKVARAEIEVDAIRLHCRADGDSGFDTVFEGDPILIELVHLRNGLVQGLNGGLLAAGSYAQIRMHITDALLEMKDGRVFSTRDGTIRLSSQDSSGYKIFLDPPVVVREGVETRVLLDFQLPRTFSAVPANDFDRARFLNLHPNVRSAVLQETGELRGTVTTTDELGAEVPAANAAVYVLAPGETDTELAVATTLTDANGQAAILGVPTGTYDVRAALDGRAGQGEGLTVSLGAVTSFEIALE
jgi:uncharacterized protein DUF4382/carboxypeptidase family protein